MAALTEHIRSHRVLLLLICGTCCAFAGAFLQLWFKLPVWAPEWVVANSPMAEPIIRAAQQSGGVRNRAQERIVAMGSSQVPRLLLLLDDPDQAMREFAAGCLEHLPDERAVLPLFKHLSKQKDGRVWTEALAKQDPVLVADLLVPQLVTGKNRHDVLLLASVNPDERLVAPLQAIMEQHWEQEVLNDPRNWQQPTTMAAMALAVSPCPAALPALLNSFASPDPIIRRRVVIGIAMGDHPWVTSRRPWDARIKDLLLRAMMDGDGQVRISSAMTIGMQQVDGAEALLIEMSKSSDSKSRQAAISWPNGRWFGPAGQRRILECLLDPDPQVRLFAIYACRWIRDPPPTTELLATLSSTDAKLREAACSVLNRTAHLQDPRLFPTMLRLMDDPDFEVARRAEITAWSAVSTPEQKRLMEEASERFKPRKDAGK